MQIRLWRLASIGFWLSAAGMVLLFEAQMICHRAKSVTFAATARPSLFQKRDPIIEQSVCGNEGTRWEEVDQRHKSAILVVGSTGAALDGVFEVTLRIERASPSERDRHNRRGIVDEQKSPSGDFCIRQVSESNMPCLLPPSKVRRAVHVAPPKTQQIDTSHRLFFLPTTDGSLDDCASYLAMDCRLVGEAASIRVYAEQSVPENQRLRELITELTRLADKSIGPAIHTLVGSVRDVDGDGKLSVVLTTGLGRRGTAFAEVDGLTRASDFVRQVSRPLGNEADVVFLNANIQTGERLRAVLAHEWAHAAVFGRRYGDGGRDAEQPPAEDDWLNEALAHLIEVRTSGSSSNVSHRIQHYLERPEAAPLLVRDYCRPEYWRHHGCRGAAYLFLDWCINQSGPQLLDRLIDADAIGVESLERATGRSFDDLFRGWTTSIGTTLAGNDEITGCVTNAIDSNTVTLRQATLTVRPTVHEWRPDGMESQSITLRLRGTTAAFVRVTLSEAAANWRLSTNASSECGLQLTVIPIERTEEEVLKTDECGP